MGTESVAQNREPNRRDRLDSARKAASALVALLLLLSGTGAGVPEEPNESEPAVAIRSGGTVAKDPRSSLRKSKEIIDSSIDDPVAAAIDAITRCQARFAEVQDYRCKFVKRERIDGTMTQPHVMAMKARTRPFSVYFKFDRPNKGREAIYVEGRNKGKVIAHDVGLFKVLAGTMNLDPRGSTAMEENRHPITEAGIGALIETVAKRWALELRPDNSTVVIRPGMSFNGRMVTLLESVHPNRSPEFLHHMVRLYVDDEHGLPIRFEAYDWPKHSGAAADLVEEYSYLNLELNVGLSEHDFDPGNRSYSFGRF